MNIDHIHFYVEDAARSRDWFVNTMGFRSIAGGPGQFTQIEVIKNGPVYFVLSSPLTQRGPVAEFLRAHPSGVADLAFGVANVEAAIAWAIAAKAKVLQHVQVETGAQGSLRWARIMGWGALEHTLIERSGITPLLPGAIESGFASPLVGALGQLPQTNPCFTGIDHVVLNVTAGDLQPAINWYQDVLQFRPNRSFEIQTARSALCSKVLVHPDGSAQLPINEPTSPGSQIQEFLDLNGGPGIQHIALHTTDIIQAIAQFRQCGLAFLDVPTDYYIQLQQRSGAASLNLDWQAIQAQQVLVDWQEWSPPQTALLQTFTRPIFAQPTFFFELIQRQAQAQGFGEGNFLALFEAIEQEQIKRGSLR